MTMRLNPYLNFRTESRAALEFYQSVFGGTLQLMTFGEGNMSDDPAHVDLLMHGHLQTEAGFDLMASDTPPGGDRPSVGTAINLSVNGSDPTIRDYWKRLSDGAEIVVPLAPAPWGDEFGLLNDKFAIAWLFNLAGS